MGIGKGDKARGEARDGRIFITPALPRYTLANLLKGTTPANYRKTAVAWGPYKGREIVD